MFAVNKEQLLSEEFRAAVVPDITLPQLHKLLRNYTPDE